MQEQQKVTLKFFIQLRNNMVVTNLIVSTKFLNKEELESMRSEADNNKIEGVVEFYLPSLLLPFMISIEGLGTIETINEKIIFNFTYNGKKLYAEDKETIINENSKFLFTDPNVILPN